MGGEVQGSARRWRAIFGGPPEISSNQIAASGVGIFFNLMYDATSTFTVADNSISAINAPSDAPWQGVLITSIYLPNGNPQPGPKFDYKLAWFERLIEHGADLMKAGVPVVLAGDYNVVPTVEDIYPTRSLDDNALIQPQSRQAYARLLAQGWTDALRKLQPEGPLWTFWDYERNRWPLDKGMRLDHFLLSPTGCDRLVRGGVDRWVRGEENASDHAPAWIVLDR